MKGVGIIFEQVLNTSGQHRGHLNWLQGATGGLQLGNNRAEAALQEE